MILTFLEEKKRQILVIHHPSALNISQQSNLFDLTEEQIHLTFCLFE